MPLTRSELPEELIARLGVARRLVLPAQGMTSDVAIVETDSGRFVVKRATRPLFAAWLAREYEVLRALESLSLPVPRGQFFHERNTASGRECWMVMEYLPGVTLTQVLENEHDPERRRDIAVQWGALLARIHATPTPPELVPATGSWLDDRLQQAAYNLAHYSTEGDARLLRDLEARRPAPVAQTLIHGDFTLDNTLVHDGTISGVIGWGFGSLGDPRYDLALAVELKPGIFDEADRAAFWSGYGPSHLSDDDYEFCHDLYEFF
jgi:aminoglycoside phosphotransferase (APT) family kinase protein